MTEELVKRAEALFEHAAIRHHCVTEQGERVDVAITEEG